MGIAFELGAQPERISVVLFVIDLTMRHIFLLSATLGLISQFAAQDSWTQMTSPSGNGRHHPITVANDQYGYVLAGQAACQRPGTPVNAAELRTLFQRMLLVR